MKMQRSVKGAQSTFPKSSSCEELALHNKSYAFTQSSSCSYKSTDDLPTSVVECFQESSLIGRFQNSLLLFIGRGSRYKIMNSKGCSLFSLISSRKKQEDNSSLLSSQSEETETRSTKAKTPLKQVHSLPLRSKTTSPPAVKVSSSNNNESLTHSASNESKYSSIDNEAHLTCKEEEALLRQYLSLQQLAIARRHCNQLRSIRDSLTGKARPRSRNFVPTKDQEELRNFLMDVGFVQYYVVLNRHGYDFETATHMNVFDLAAVGITEPLHRMALKYELDQVRRSIKRLENISETIEEWLEGLSLSEYVEHFHQNGIYCPLAAVGLTKRDLQLMGIYLLGHRKKLVLALSAIGMSLTYGNCSKDAS